MPSLQLDLPTTMSPTEKQALAGRLGAVYAQIMRVSPDLVTVAIRDHGPGSVWRCTSGDPVASALIMCDVRRGRDRETRARLARELIALCEASAGVAVGVTKVEFTQHDGDEMFHPHLGGFNRDWTADEVPAPAESLDREAR